MCALPVEILHIRICYPSSNSDIRGTPTGAD
jgi:hypothetical protein